MVIQRSVGVDELLDLNVKYIGPRAEWELGDNSAWTQTYQVVSRYRTEKTSVFVVL